MKRSRFHVKYHPEGVDPFALPRRWALVVGFCMFTAAAALDYATPYQLSLGSLYLFAILAVSWNCGMAWGLAFTALSMGCQIALGIAQGHPFLKDLYFFQSQANVLLEYAVAVVLTSQLRRLFERERQTARIDHLTGVKNRQGFHEVLESEVARHLRNGASFCLAYIDVDDFKGVNDRFGHSEGDRLLEAVGHVTAASVRRSDTVGRIGGDEFAVLFPETNQAEALAIEGKLREALHTITRPRPWWSVTFSMGVATFKSMPSSADAAMSFVDQLMYRAKRSGKAHTITAVFEGTALHAESGGIVALRRIPGGHV
jgi:diguanylate cyclase (GGDEF)-like protein